jgi:hypothetical protein
MADKPKTTHRVNNKTGITLTHNILNICGDGTTLILVKMDKFCPQMVAIYLYLLLFGVRVGSITCYNIIVCILQIMRNIYFKSRWENCVFVQNGLQLRRFVQCSHKSCNISCFNHKIKQAHYNQYWYNPPQYAADSWTWKTLKLSQHPNTAIMVF